MGLRLSYFLSKRRSNQKKEAALWLFLGAHQWVQHPEELDDLARCSLKNDPEAPDRQCCCSQFGSMEVEYAKELVSSFSKSERIWLVRQIIRRASEYGQCLDLGGYLFTYFVVRDFSESSIMLETLVDEITCSPLRYTFEHSIGLAYPPSDCTSARSL